MKRLLLILALLSAPLLAAAPRVSSYAIDASFTPAESSMAGEAEVVFMEPAQGEVSFYLHGELRVEWIRLGDEELEFTEERVAYRYDYSWLANRVSVALPRETDRLAVKWQGYFSPSKARSPSDYMRIGPEGVLLRAYYYSPWFPLFAEPGEDPPAVSFPRVTIRTPREYVSVFTGELVSRTTEGDLHVSTWKGTGLDLSAAQVTARPFVAHREGDFFAYSLDDRRSRAAAAEILTFIRKLDAEYRRRFRSEAVAGQIHVMQMPPYGDISSGNVVGLSDEIWFGLAGDADARRGIAHELVHPFVTPPIPRTDPLFALVVEGFPSYFHLPVLAELGALDYERYMNRTESSYLEKRATGTGWRGRPLPNEKPIATIAPEEIGIYKDTFVLSDRSLLFLDFLRRTMGPETFDRFAAALTAERELTLARFRELVSRFAPAAAADADLWLTTNEFPDRWRRTPKQPDHQPDAPGSSSL